jgi:putative two-component system response regulator
MNERVLIVDDEANILNSIRRLISQSSLDVEAVFSQNAEEAVGIIRESSVAVVISDNQMPGMSGIDLLSLVASISPRTIRIIMTGYADLATSLAAINRCGVFKFIVKPWDDDNLLDSINESLTRYRILRSLERSDEATLRSLAQTIELKDRYTRGHCDRVASYAIMLADALNLDEGMKKSIKYGSWLHDCGKIGVPEAVLNKEGKLTEEEYEGIRQHPLWGADVARQALLPAEVVNVVLYHHERFDGNGYPSGISGKNIPLEARIVTIADVYDALTTDRSYHRKRTLEGAREIMESMRNTAFDPELIDLFFTLVENNNIAASEAVSNG